MKKTLKKIHHLIKARRIERGESHFNRSQTSKILTVGFFSLLGYVMLVPPTPSMHTGDEQMVFQFHGAASDWGITGEQTHGAADRWNYLFDSATGSTQTFTGTATNASTTNTFSIPITSSLATTIPTDLLGSSSIKTRYSFIITGVMVEIPNYYVAVETIIFKMDLAIYYLERYLPGDYSKLKIVSSTGYIPKDCISPSGESTVLHGDFMIAYQQRTDVTSVCNVEKRYCNDGVLGGTYTGEFCDERVAYAYDKIIPTSANEFIPGEFIQPTPPTNSDADFNSQGQLDNPLQATTQWNSQPANAIIVTNSGISQSTITYRSCRTPRGEKVLNGQFVRAYKAKQGYFNRPCEVEIRMCIDGKLKGTFKNKSCAYTGMSYEMANGIR